jgi:hypothetical protein
MFAVPDTIVTDGGFGQITTTKNYGTNQALSGYPSRTLQLALKLYW